MSAIGGKSYPMQELITFWGTTLTADPILMPRPMNVQPYKELSLNVEVIENRCSGTPAQLILETGIGAEGPWWPLATYSSSGYCCASLYLTARESGTNKFQRFVRWKIDNSGAGNPVWSMTFRICATMR